MTPGGQQQQAISIYFFLEGLGFGVQGLGLLKETTGGEFRVYRASINLL